MMLISGIFRRAICHRDAKTILTQPTDRASSLSDNQTNAAKLQNRMHPDARSLWCQTQSRTIVRRTNSALPRARSRSPCPFPRLRLTSSLQVRSTRETAWCAMLMRFIRRLAIAERWTTVTLQYQYSSIQFRYHWYSALCARNLRG
jgi:hypothetical protein